MEYLCIMMAKIFSLPELPALVKKCLETWAPYRVFAFHGPMGAGKTTFIHALCAEMQVEDAVSSPTFSLINEYDSPRGAIYHMDLYRLRDEQEAIGAGIEDALYSGNICFVEWPEKAGHLLPEDTVHIYLEPGLNNTRKLRAVMPGEKS